MEATAQHLPQDSKYGYVAVEKKDIPEDEPLFILRGKDQLTPLAMEAYISALAAVGFEANNPKFMSQLRLARDRVLTFQREHPERVRLPD